MGLEHSALNLVRLAVGAAKNNPELQETIGLGSASVAVLAGLLVLLAIKVGFVGMAAWFTRSFPAVTARALEQYKTRGERSFLWGLSVLFVTVLIILALLSSKTLGFLGILLAVCLLGFVAAGYTTAYLNLGQRLTEGSEPGSHTRTILLGGIAAEAAFLMPLLGQLLSLGMLCRGLGAVISALPQSRQNGTDSE